MESRAAASGRKRTCLTVRRRHRATRAKAQRSINGAHASVPSDLRQVDLATFPVDVEVVHIAIRDQGGTEKRDERQATLGKLRCLTLCDLTRNTQRAHTRLERFLQLNGGHLAHAVGVNDGTAREQEKEYGPRQRTLHAMFRLETGY